MIRHKPEPRRRDEIIVPINNLQVPEIGRPVEPFSGEMAAAHLRGRVRALRPRVDHLAAELHHVGVPSQVREERRRPVADQRARPVP